MIIIIITALVAIIIILGGRLAYYMTEAEFQEGMAERYIEKYYDLLSKFIENEKAKQNKK